MTAIGINPLEHPVMLQMPERRADSHWVEHAPFAMWLMSALRPRVFVELGAYLGVSYCAFCQAARAIGLETRGYAVDTWRGDPHNGVNGPEVLADLRAHHDPRHGAFSTLLEMCFDQAAARFPDGSIDLLHIDGYHTYEAVRHDYQSWRAKLSERGVILFHDVAERRSDFGVWRFWDEVKGSYPSFTFEHEHGLGVLAVGSELPDDVRRLVALSPEQADFAREFFHAIGERARVQFELDSLGSTATPGDDPSLVLQALVAQYRAITAERALRPDALNATFERLTRENHMLHHERDEIAQLYCEADAERARLEREVEELRSSVSYAIARGLSTTALHLAPPSSRRRRALGRAAAAVCSWMV